MIFGKLYIATQVNIRHSIRKQMQKIEKIIFTPPQILNVKLAKNQKNLHGSYIAKNPAQLADSPKIYNMLGFPWCI